MVSRKVPVPRARGGAAHSAGRTVSRPGVNSEAGSSNFQSPFQPPAADMDLASDVAMLDPNAWHFLHVAGEMWRVKVPDAASLQSLNQIAQLSGGAQVEAINALLARHMHMDDFSRMLERMVDPEDTFGAAEYRDLYRKLVTTGTSRPFWQSSGLPAPQPITGGPFGRVWRTVEYMPRFRI